MFSKAIRDFGPNVTLNIVEMDDLAPKENDFIIFWTFTGYFGVFTMIGLAFYVFDECCRR